MRKFMFFTNFEYDKHENNVNKYLVNILCIDSTVQITTEMAHMPLMFSNILPSRFHYSA